MEYVLVVLAAWAIWSAAEKFLDAPQWFWQAFPILLCVGGQALIDPSYLWYGIGLGGATRLLMLGSDILLVTADWIRFSALRQQRGTSR